MDQDPDLTGVAADQAKATPTTISSAAEPGQTAPPGLRAIAFVWVLLNVYLLAMRLAMPGPLPPEFFPALLVTIICSWAALECRRWGWFAMMLLAAASLADTILGFALISANASMRGAATSEMVDAWTRELAVLGLGPWFGALTVTAWVVSIGVLASRRVREPVFANKREHLSAGQALIAVVVLTVYLVGVAAIGATATALRVMRDHPARSRSEGRRVRSESAYGPYGGRREGSRAAARSGAMSAAASIGPTSAPPATGLTATRPQARAGLVRMWP